VCSRASSVALADSIVLSTTDFTDDPLEPANCDFSECVFPVNVCHMFCLLVISRGLRTASASMFFTQFIDKKGPEHSLSAVGGIFGLLGDGFDVRGGFLAMEVLACLILSLGFGKVAMEHIMINAIPELPKWDPFYWKDALDICGLVVGAPAQSISTTCCQGCCVPGQSSTCGNGQFTIRNACFLYCACMCGWAVIMMLYVILFAHMCVLPFLFEMMVLMMVTWTLIYPFEASFLACLGFGVDTQATESEDGGAGAASRFVNPMAEDDDDGESSPTGRQRWGAPEPEDMDIVE
jgi:hypothetical protein